MIRTIVGNVGPPNDQEASTEKGRSLGGLTVPIVVAGLNLGMLHCRQRETETWRYSMIRFVYYIIQQHQIDNLNAKSMGHPYFMPNSIS
jgi:hypothetical protein